MARAKQIPGLEPDDEFRTAAATVVAMRAREMFEEAHDVLDTSDIERVHDMRVATRRLRAVLEIFEACFDPAQHREVLRDVKLWKDANAVLAQANQRFPDDAELLFLEGVLLREAGDLRGAAAAFERLLTTTEGDHFASVDAALRGEKARRMLETISMDMGTSSSR